MRKFFHKPFNDYQMYALKITKDYDNITITNCTNIENKDNNILFKNLFLLIPRVYYYFLQKV